MKALKIILSIVAVVAILLIAAGYFVFRNIDGIAEDAIESVGTDMLQTEVGVEAVKLTLTQGRGEIKGVTIDNLSGYNQPHLFSLDNVALQVDPETLRDPVIVINELLVDGAKLTLEHKGVAETNLQQLLDTIKARAGDDQPSDGPGREMRFRVETLKFNDVTMDIVSPQIENRTVSLPPIERSNLGTVEQGLTPKELGLAILQPLLEQARDKFEGEVKGRVGAEVEEALDRNLSPEDRAKIDQLKSLLR